MSNDHPEQIPEDQLPPQDYPPRRLRPKITLVELLVCIAVLGVLVALLLPAVQTSHPRRSAPRSLQQEHQRRLELIEQAEAAQREVDARR